MGPISVRVRPLDDPGAPIIRCQAEEEDAFWAWAVVKILRLTGIRLEERLELTHLSIREHRMPDGQSVLLLQIAPSKTDRERALPICPELAHVLATVIARVRGNSDHVPLVWRYDPHERTTGPPLPYLLQRININGARRVLMGKEAVPNLLARAATRAGLRDVDGQPLRFTAHDFRRLFATAAVNGGLPIHIAAKLLGHLDLNTTRGYVAVYPDEVVRHFQAHLARRRAGRPSEEYREPTDAEWKEFQNHFRHRKMALGDCYRPSGRTVPTSTRACDARCCAWTPAAPEAFADRTEHTRPGCPKPGRRAGTGRRQGLRRPCSTSPRRRRRWTESGVCLSFSSPVVLEPGCCPGHARIFRDGRGSARHTGPWAPACRNRRAGLSSDLEPKFGIRGWDGERETVTGYACCGVGCRLAGCRCGGRWRNWERRAARPQRGVRARQERHPGHR
ncbi:MAG: tyrosine-type recombinase/integrase [Actinobacteria bacterium]|nr:tyrosine-type recombinase/integrase [Actinomycetota bacterium]